MPLLVAALLTIPALIIEESAAGDTLDTVATVLNWIVWLAFVAEAVLMLRAVDSKRAWVRSHPLGS